MRLLLLLPLPLLAACATPRSTALEPVTLANGQKIQGIVTVAADRSGAAPALTMVQSFDVSQTGKTVLIATETGTSPGIATVLAGSMPGAAPALLHHSSRGNTTVNNSVQNAAVADAAAINVNSNLGNNSTTTDDTNLN